MPLKVICFYLETNRLSELITTEKVGEIDRIAYEKALDAIKSANQSRSDLLDQLEQTLGQIEAERSNNVSNQVSVAFQELKSLNFQHPLTIEKMLQNECSKINLYSLKNKQAIIRYISGLRVVIADSTENLQLYHKKFGVDWPKARYKYTFSSFSKQIQKVLNVDVAGLYERYNQKFQSVVELQEDSVIKLI